MKRVIIGFIIGILVCGVVGVSAYNLLAKDIAYKDTNVEDALDDLYDKSAVDLIWTNSSPTSSFAAQTININLSNYNYIVIVLVTSDGSSIYDWTPHSTILLPVLSSWDGYSAKASATGTSLTRGLKVETGKIIFTDAKYTDGETNNAGVIPYKIYGIKQNINLDLGID